MTVPFPNLHREKKRRAIPIDILEAVEVVRDGWNGLLTLMSENPLTPVSWMPIHRCNDIDIQAN